MFTIVNENNQLLGRTGLDDFSSLHLFTKDDFKRYKSLSLLFFNSEKNAQNYIDNSIKKSERFKWKIVDMKYKI